MLGSSKMRLKIEEQQPTLGRFVIEPLDQGFGHTLGNGLRRVLLSALEGAAVTQIKIAGVTHQFTTITGVSEDVVEMVLNIKKLRLTLDDNGPYRLHLQAKGPGDVTAKQIEAPTGVEIINKDLHIATLADAKTNLDIELVVQKGAGYALADEHKTNEIGVIAIDALFSPITRVNYSVDPTRVGRLTNFDKLSIEVATDGTIEPLVAIKEASRILADHFTSLIDADTRVDEADNEASAQESKASKDILSMSVEELDLPSRVTSRLVEHGIKSIGDLVNTPKEELLSMKSFGKKSYDLVAEKLQELGVTL